MGKKKLFLHIGRHKTGTSSLQRFFAEKSDLLAERGIIYPKTGRLSPSGSLALAHHAFSHTLLYKPEDSVDALLDELKAEADGYDKILLSSEDFQNQKDFSRIEKLFEPYDVTVICYLREGLGYGLSGFAQRIHFSSEIFNIRQYMERQNIRITGFVRAWSRVADESIFRLYERDKLKNRDIVADFLDIIGLEDVEDTNVVLESNPSLSGNLLGLKMVLNLIGQSMLVPYGVFESAAKLDPTFRGKIFVSDRVAEELRGLDDYNAVLKAMFPDMAEPSFEKGSKVFDLTRWNADMDLIATIPELAFAKTLRLGALGQVLEAEGVLSDLGEMDFLSEEVLSQIRLPDDTKVTQIQARAVGAANDAVIARKARSDAERAAAIAKEDARQAMAKRDEMAEKLKARTAKLEKDNAIVSDQLAVAIKDRDVARAEIKSQAEKAQAEAKSSLETFNKRVEVLSEERDSLSEKLKTVVEERDSARSELKSLSEKAQAEAKSSLETFNKRVEALSEERDSLSKKLKAVIGERDDARQELKAQSKKIQAETAKSAKIFKARVESVSAERDAVRAELKAQSDKLNAKLKSNLNAFQAQLEGLKSERETLGQQVKSITSDRDKTRKALEAKNAQLDVQAGQVYFFRAELLRLKGEMSKAREMYESALEKDPGNADYAKRLDELD